jgi:predicted dinucleotide-binding enzyme
MGNISPWSRRAAIGAALGVLAGFGRNVRAAQTPLKIATIGAGHIGGTLGAVWVKAGHQVMFSSRHPEELQDLVASLGPKAQAGSVAEAVAFADVVLLAVPYGALPEIAKDYARDLARKALVFDACNPFPNRDGDVAAQALAKGAGLYTAELLPGAAIVRAFNAIPAARFGEGGLRDGVRMGIPIAGDDKKALALASELIRETGYEPVVVGNLDFGKYLRPGTPLAGEHTPDQIRAISATLK